MKLIDLTLPIVTGMPVYPGDPPVRVREARDLARHGFRLHEITLGSHTGTHVNAPWHMAEKGARLEELPLAHFVARAVVRQKGEIEPSLARPSGTLAPPKPARPSGTSEPIEFPEDVGLVYADFALDESELHLVLAARPPFVAQAVEYPLDATIERALCEAGIVSFENLANTWELPRGGQFLFVGLPLAVAGDGAPVRAVAIL